MIITPKFEVFFMLCIFKLQLVLNIHELVYSLIE